MDMGVGPSSAKIDLSKIKRGPIVAALIIGAFVSILNETLLNIAFPSLMEQFGIGEATVQWLSTSYMLVVGILVPITALLQLWFSTRQMFIGAMSLFLVGTIICGFAPVFGVLLTGRILQAVGTGLMIPVLMNTILSIYPPQNRGAAMGMIGLVIMTAPAIGPTLSGLIVDALNWRWLFYLVMPLAAFSIIFAAMFLKNVTELTKPKVDFISIILSTIGFGGIVYGFSSAGEGSWSDPVVIWCIAAGAISLLLFVWRQLSMKEPMLDLRTFKYPMFSLVTILMLVLMMSMFSTMIMLPLFLQNALGMTALAAGLVMMPGGIINGLMAPITGKLFDKFGPRVLVIPGLVLLVIAIFLFSRVNASWTGGYVIFLHVMMMIGISMVMMPAQTTALNQLPRLLYPHGTAIMNTLQQVAGAVGMALFISIMTAGAKNYVVTTGDLNPVESMIAGLHSAFITGLVLAIAALVLGLFVKRASTPSEQERSAA
ncbi:DHA2 family efflux MFS transporter permease subunit [Paenibacillus lactis]|uniref:Drug resistance transporter, EmrB/QacA subfamily n=2 Tax=Paenibacillus TaxID=44249 RepID=G4HHI9_9BACL|nr:MDR family MFS transporter [Paenibacillus lactis]EHB63565.1 drug resistance transporter, EmrB/QacA subfamily [Paenibacillus lactis 154]MCM3494310.1 DHA2 family efflux MFS transporter permease subunit [Paenibacillus lactis]GIO89091.1 multidrug MFS transporter [Paenibacillus lactis]